MIIWMTVTMLMIKIIINDKHNHNHNNNNNNNDKEDANNTNFETMRKVSALRFQNKEFKKKLHFKNLPFHQLFPVIH